MNKLLWVFIGVLILVILIQSMWKNKPTNQTIKVDGVKYDLISKTRDTIYVPYTDTIYQKGGLISKVNTVYVNLPSNVDTNLILKDYYSNNIYIDTLKLKDSLGFVSIRDTISKNLISSRVFDEHINQKTIINTIVVKDIPKNQLYIGGNIGIQKPNILMFGPSLLFKTKSDKIYGIQAGFNSEMNGYIQGSLYWKIQLNK